MRYTWISGPCLVPRWQLTGPASPFSFSRSFMKREREREGSEKLNDLENSVINKSWLFSFREKEFEIHRMGLELEIVSYLLSITRGRGKRSERCLIGADGRNLLPKIDSRAPGRSERSRRRLSADLCCPPSWFTTTVQKSNWSDFDDGTALITAPPLPRII